MSIFAAKSVWRRAALKAKQPKTPKVPKPKKPKLGKTKSCCEENQKHSLIEFRQYSKRPSGFYIYQSPARKDYGGNGKYQIANFCPFCRKDLKSITEKFYELLTGEKTIESESANEITLEEIGNG